MPLPPSPRAVVTGAGSGLGRALCVELARRGARLIVSDVDLAAAEATATALNIPDAHPVRCDVAQVTDVEALGAETDRLLGGADLLVNNAGVAVSGPIGDVPIAEWQWIVGVNLYGPIHGCHVFVPRFKKQGSGAILNVASAAGLLASPQMGPYNVTKSGVVALSETLYGELRPFGIGVSVLCPTFFQTNIVNSSKSHGDPGMLAMARGLMTNASVQADDVARIALDGVANGELYILPHADGRWMWRLKRLHPSGFQALALKALQWRAGRAG